MSVQSAEPLAIPIERLRKRSDPANFAALGGAAGGPATTLVGQPRAQQALGFGLAMQDRSFNVFLAGAPGTGRTSAARAFLEEAARSQPPAPDWCYIHNFRDPARPRALRLPAGMGRRLKDDVDRLVQATRQQIVRVFESDEYAAQRETIVNELNHRRAESYERLSELAAKASFQIQPLPTGFAVVPMLSNRPLSEDDLAGLRPEMRAEIERRRAALDPEIAAFTKTMRAVDHELRDRLLAQDHEVALHAVGGLVDDTIESYHDQPEVVAFLDGMRTAILDDIDLFRGQPEQQSGATPDGDTLRALAARSLRKYTVNLLIDNGEATSAPVVTELNPTLTNLAGRVEREAVLGALVTDFTLISSGALHRANGGFLLLHLDDLLRQPLAWETLKRCLREGAILIEDPSEALGINVTRGLRPDPIPLDVKVFLIGEPYLFEVLSAADADFRDLFKVRVDVDTEIDRSPENERLLAEELDRTCAGRLPLDPDAAAALVEEASRMAADQRKLSARIGDLADLLREASYWAQTAGAKAVGAAHVRHALQQRRVRASLASDRWREYLARGIVLFEAAGRRVGQINGLAVVGGAGAAFGQPTRITCTIGVGRDGLLDIERQVQMGGPIYSKGMLIVGGYLLDTYAQDKPLALSARLVFEQSYGGIEGDSASLAELLALLSRLADAPLEQRFAVTGSVNQRGEVQAIGGANEKIEGFYDACMAVGFSGEQGVVVPAANVDNLMLREDVVDAVTQGRFRVYAVRHVDEALELLSGLPVGQKDAAGVWTAGSLHARIDARLTALARALDAYGGPQTAGRDGVAAHGMR